MSEYETTTVETTQQPLVSFGGRVDADERRIWLGESMTTDVVWDVIRALIQLDGLNHEHIELWVTSPGGDAEAVFALLDVMDNLTAEVVVVGCGLVASAGAYLLLGADHRLVYPHTQLMLHGPGMGIGPGGGSMTLTEMEVDVTHMRYLRRRMVALIERRTHFTEVDAQLILEDGADHWFRGGRAIVDAGLADTVLEPEPEVSGS